MPNDYPEPKAQKFSLGTARKKEFEPVLDADDERLYFRAKRTECKHMIIFSIVMILLSTISALILFFFGNP